MLLQGYTVTIVYSFKAFPIPPPCLKHNRQITALPRERGLAGTEPEDPLRTCLVVVWLMAEQQAQEGLLGEDK